VTAGEQRPYRFGPRDQRGLVLGIRPAQAAVVAGALTVAVGLLRTTRGAGTAVGLIVDLVTGGVVAFVPVRGRTTGEWLTTLAGFAAAAMVGHRREVSNPPFSRRERRPSAFAPFSVESAGDGAGRSIGVIVDRRSSSSTAIVAVGGTGFALLDDPERDRVVASWSSVLSALASSPLAPTRVQWIERTVPDRCEALRARVSVALSGAGSENVGVRAVETKASYAALVEAESNGAFRHECVIAVTVKGVVEDRGERARGRRQITDGEGRLVATVASLEERLAGGGFVVRGALTRAGVVAYLDRTFRDRPAPPATSDPWPIACEARWGTFRTDALYHATYWIAEWPRSAVSSEFLFPILNEGEGRRTIVIVMAPVDPRRAARRVEHARTSARADDEVRRRHGFVTSARTSRQHEAVVQREEELASGHAGYRFSGYVAVAAADQLQLERGCARIEQAGALARLDLRRLFGSQASAFTSTLPVGRGCA
jgi:hypothetical protein